MKRKRIRRVLTIAIIISMFVTSIDVGVLWKTVNAEEKTSYYGKCGASAEWKIEDGILTVMGKGAIEDYWFLRNESPWNRYNSQIKKVIIKNGITSIGSYCFWGCGVTDIYIPDSVTEIKQNAFEHCEQLSNLRMSQKLEKLCWGAFAWCYSLDKLVLPDTLKYVEGHCMRKSKISELIFEGDAPEVNVVNGSDDFFEGIVTTVYYNKNCKGWNKFVEKYPNQKYVEMSSSIIEAVKKYSTDNETFKKMLLAISEKNLPNDVKMQLMSSVCTQYGFDNVKEGIEYVQDASSTQRAYQTLVNNEQYGSWQFGNYLNNTTKGKVARGLLYADGMIFNGELKSWMDPGTYVENDYPGIKKYKTLLTSFIGKKSDEFAVCSNVDSVIKNYNNMVKIKEIDDDVLLEKIMDAKTDKEKDELIKKLFAKEKLKLNDDGKTVAATDLLVPGIGEIIGGSQREENYDKLLNRMKELNMPINEYDWYLDLRKYGSCNHAGFGLGFERAIMYLTGMQNIRDVIPFPRTPKNCDF